MILFKPHIIFVMNLLLLALLNSCQNNDNIAIQNNQLPMYQGNDLGVTYYPEFTEFKIWSPKADYVKLKLYDSENKKSPYRTYNMVLNKDGVWLLKVNEDLLHQYYNFVVSYNGKELQETPGIYAKAVSNNGDRGVIVEIGKTNPLNWKTQNKIKHAYSKAIIYETHISAFTYGHTQDQFKGKFLGLAERYTTDDHPIKTGVDHLLDLGITHLLLFPVFDFDNQESTYEGSNKYKLGFNTKNYMALEGVYATELSNTVSRIKEFKQMMHQLHENGINVIIMMDFSRSYDFENSAFNQEFPNYYYRPQVEGKAIYNIGGYNYFASEKGMMKKYFIDLIKYWVEEFHIDGFYFKNGAAFHHQTLVDAKNEVEKIKKNIMFIAEGWEDRVISNYPDQHLNISKLHRIDSIVMVNNSFRHAIMGSRLNTKDSGFIGGNPISLDRTKAGLISYLKHPQFPHATDTSTNRITSDSPYEFLNQTSNYRAPTTLKSISMHFGDKDKYNMQRETLAYSLLLSSQGVPYIKGGEEFGSQVIYNNENNITNNNSFIEWSLKNKHISNYNFIKQLIQFRKDANLFNLLDQEAVASQVSFIDGKTDSSLIIMKIEPKNQFDKRTLVVFNSSKKKKLINLPPGYWYTILDPQTTYKGLDHTEYTIAHDSLEVLPISATYLISKE